MPSTLFHGISYFIAFLKQKKTDLKKPILFSLHLCFANVQLNIDYKNRENTLI
jgi:hypothetical protein